KHRKAPRPNAWHLQSYPDRHTTTGGHTIHSAIHRKNDDVAGVPCAAPEHSGKVADHFLAAGGNRDPPQLAAVDQRQLAAGRRPERYGVRSLGTLDHRRGRDGEGTQDERRLSVGQDLVDHYVASIRRHADCKGPIPLGVSTSNRTTGASGTRPER